MAATTFLAQIRDRIARDELPEALEQLRAFLGNTPKLDEILYQSGRFENIRRQIRLGVVSHAEANLTENQIRAGLLELVSEIENVGRVSNPSDVELREEIERAISIVNSKNVVVGSTISAGGSVHIGDTYYRIPSTSPEPEKPKNTKNAVRRTVLIVALGIGIGFLGELMPDDLKASIETWVTAHLHLPFWKFWLLMATALVTFLLWLTWKDALGKDANAKSTAKDFEPEIRDWLKKRYQNRLDQKLAGRLPINLRRLDFSETAAQLAQKHFKEIAPEAVEAELTEFFRTAEGRLLLVGAPGAGKTTLLLQLAVGLLETEADALPAVVNLATWSREFTTLDEWLRKILPVELGVSTALAVRLLAESRVVLLFDGLDEIPDAEQRAACLAAIDQFVSPARPRREFAISSRTEEFRAAGRMPLVSFPIEVGPLEMAQIERELTRRDPAQPEDRDLLAALRADPLLRETAETPFYFNCLQLLFGENRRPVFSAGERAGREREVLDFFVENELGKCARPEAGKWLSFLAERMSARELVRFELRDLQYDWWGKRKKNIKAVVLDAFVNGMVGLVVFGGTFGLVPIFLNMYPVKSGLLLFFSFFVLFITIGLFAGLFGVKPAKIETRDERIWSNLKLKAGIFAGLITGLLVGGIILYKTKALLPFFQIVIYSLVLGVGSMYFDFLHKDYSLTLQIKFPYQRFISSIPSLHFSILQHLLLRHQFAQKGLLPIRLVAFLNEMASYEPKLEKWKTENEKRQKAGKSEKPRPERPNSFTRHPVHLLESDGASWRFRHRLIQEWFAARWVETA